MEPFTWLSLTAIDPWRTSAVHQLCPYFVHKAIENPDLAIDLLELLLIRSFILMSTAVCFGKIARLSLRAQMWTCPMNIGRDNVYRISFIRELISFDTEARGTNGKTINF